MPPCAVPSLGAVAFTPLNIAPMSGCCQEANHRRWALLVEGWRRKKNKSYLCTEWDWPCSDTFVSVPVFWLKCGRRCDGSTRRGGARWARIGLAIHARRLWCCRVSPSHPRLFKDWSLCVCLRACTLLRCSRPAVACLSSCHFPRSHFFLPHLRRLCFSLACGAAVQEIEAIHGYMCSASLSLLTHARTHRRTDGQTHTRPRHRGYASRHIP